MKKTLLGAMIIGTAMLSAPNADAATAFTTTYINMRAGPETHYPVVTTINRGDQINLIGCLTGLSWCEVENRYRERGWVSGDYIQTYYNNRPVIVKYVRDPRVVPVEYFSVNDYWDRNYRDKNFYVYRERYGYTPVRYYNGRPVTYMPYVPYTRPHDYPPPVHYPVGWDNDRDDHNGWSGGRPGHSGYSNGYRGDDRGGWDNRGPIEPNRTYH